jgi:hypothetical protein
MAQEGQVQHYPLRYQKRGDGSSTDANFAPDSLLILTSICDIILTQVTLEHHYIPQRGHSLLRWGTVRCPQYTIMMEVSLVSDQLLS